MTRLRKTTRIKLRGQAVRDRAAELGVKVSSVPERAGVVQSSRRAFELWLSGKRFPDIEDVERIAQFLGVPPSHIAEIPPEVLAQSGDIVRSISAGRSDLTKLVEALGKIQIRVSDFLPFLRRVSLRFRPLDGWAHEFVHRAESTEFYAQVRIQPLWKECPAGGARFVFGYELGGIRVDFGQVYLDPEGNLRLTCYFDRFVDNSRDDAGRGFLVWTWFGLEPCRFVVYSTSPFALEQVEDPRRRRIDQRPTGVLVFPAGICHDPKALNSDT